MVVDLIALISKFPLSSKEPLEESSFDACEVLGDMVGTL